MDSKTLSKVPSIYIIGGTHDKSLDLNTKLNLISKSNPSVKYISFIEGEWYSYINQLNNCNPLENNNLFLFSGFTHYYNEIKNCEIKCLQSDLDYLNETVYLNKLKSYFKIFVSYLIYVPELRILLFDNFIQYKDDNSCQTFHILFKLFKDIKYNNQKDNQKTFLEKLNNLPFFSKSSTSANKDYNIIPSTWLKIQGVDGFIDSKFMCNILSDGKSCKSKIRNYALFLKNEFNFCVKNIIKKIFETSFCNVNGYNIIEKVDYDKIILSIEQGQVIENNIIEKYNIEIRDEINSQSIINYLKTNDNTGSDIIISCGQAHVFGLNKYFKSENFITQNYNIKNVLSDFSLQYFRSVLLNRNGVMTKQITEAIGNISLENKFLLLINEDKDNKILSVSEFTRNIINKEFPHCNFCNMTLIENLFKCSKCKNAFYCGKTCQKNDWKNHKKKCSNF